jgi:hypothetical protein
MNRQAPKYLIFHPHKNIISESKMNKIKKYLKLIVFLGCIGTAALLSHCGSNTAVTATVKSMKV